MHQTISWCSCHRHSFWVLKNHKSFLFFRYIDQFSRCLNVEYKAKGIDVQCQVIIISLLLKPDDLGTEHSPVKYFKQTLSVTFTFLLDLMWHPLLPQVPLYVATKMASVRKSSFLIPSPETYASAGLRHIGYEATCTPYWVHSAIWCVASIIPESAIDWWRIGFNLKIRKRGQVKDARKKAEWKL